MAAELAECKRAAGSSTTKVAVTLARKADAGAVNVWYVRPSPTKSDQKNLNMTQNGKIARRPQAIREKLNQRLEQ